MNPDEYQKPQNTDYLNQIAPTVPKSKTDFFRQKPVIIGAILLILIIITTILMATVGSSSGGTSPIQTLSARLVSTTNTVTSANKNIKNTKLRALNSSLNIYLSNTTRDLAPILVINKIDAKKPNKSITKAESNVAMLAVLEDARLNAVYDRVYAREMNTQLEKILLLMNQINKTTKSSQTKTFLDNAIKNLEPIQKQFADYNSPVS